MDKSSKIFIAGHMSLLGSALLKTLAEKGYHNLVIRDHSELELTDAKAVEDFFAVEKPEIVFMAAIKSVNLRRCISHPATLYLENSMIQNNLFAAALLHKTENIVYFGSSCIYPKDTLQPIKEEYFLSGPLEAATEGYAVAKLGGVVAVRPASGCDTSQFQP